jgi:hypothetical protein
MRTMVNALTGPGVLSGVEKRDAGLADSSLRSE